MFVNEGSAASDGCKAVSSLQQCKELCDGANDCQSFTYHPNHSYGGDWCCFKTKCGSNAEPTKTSSWTTYFKTCSQALQRRAILKDGVDLVASYANGTANTDQVNKPDHGNFTNNPDVIYDGDASIITLPNVLLVSYESLSRVGEFRSNTHLYARNLCKSKGEDHDFRTNYDLPCLLSAKYSSTISAKQARNWQVSLKFVLVGPSPNQFMAISTEFSGHLMMTAITVGSRLAVVIGAIPIKNCMVNLRVGGKMKRKSSLGQNTSCVFHTLAMALVMRFQRSRR